MSNYNFEREKIKKIQKSVEDNIKLLLENKEYLSPQEIQIYENMYLSYRCSGRTTRLVDAAIQQLFSNMGASKMYFADHHGSRKADILLQEKIIQRLEREHPNVSVTYDGKYISIRERTKINLKYTTGNSIELTDDGLKL